MSLISKTIYTKMVNKMNLKTFFLSFALLAHIFPAAAAQPQVPLTKHRSYVACGIEANHKLLAYQENGEWKGFDADICRAVSAAVFGDVHNIKLVPVVKKNIGKALQSGQIDLMLGHTSLSSAEEIEFGATPVETLYLDKQTFAARAGDSDAVSMRDFEGKKICVLRDSDSAVRLAEYTQKYALNFSLFELPSNRAVKEAFYLKRCDLVTGDFVFLKTMISNQTSPTPIEILPEDIGYIPVKAYVADSNIRLQKAMRWIFNALKQAAFYDMTAQNINAFVSSKSLSVQNILGTSSPKAWLNLGLSPNGIKDFIAAYGNYNQLLEKHFGKESLLPLDIKYNALYENGGFLIPQPFI